MTLLLRIGQLTIDAACLHTTWRRKNPKNPIYRTRVVVEVILADAEISQSVIRVLGLRLVKNLADMGTM